MNKKSVARYRVDQRQRWAADVAGEFDGYSGMLQDVMNQRCRRALALCPRNTNDSVLRIIAQKDLRVRRENAACLSGSRNRFNRGRDSGSLDNNFAVIRVQRIQVARSEVQGEGGIALDPVVNV